MYLTEARIDRMVRLAADYALNAVEKDVADKTLSVDVGYTVLKVGLKREIDRIIPLLEYPKSDCDAAVVASRLARST
ncbi:hypothetical protein [Methylorubrum extorquens]|uniref:hypothetical protein n=1 Tax=Methylorubrum extorquens TaxID=408 RepID=UPI0002D61513|nr:hypothetical protein [Methylorubrum extorquens]KQP94469.1 hypothetical protein ASF55_17385 [Methylobacterium sp. Leaf119]